MKTAQNFKSYKTRNKEKRAGPSILFRYNKHDITVNNLSATYVSKNNNNAAVIRSTPLTPLANGDLYYEIKILKGNKGITCGIGFVPDAYSLHRYPGWETNSIAYHGDNGQVYIGTGTGTPYTLTWSSNDIIGIWFRAASNELYFTRNGILLPVIKDIKFSNLVFPAIAMGKSKNEKVTFNFGPQFKFDMNKMNEALKVPSLFLSSKNVTTIGKYITSFYDHSTIKVKAPLQILPSGDLYFEMEVVHIDYKEEASVSIGLASYKHPLDSMVLGTRSNSLAYSSDGQLYDGNNVSDYHKEYKIGSIVGCLLKLDSCSVHFTLNGKLLKKATEIDINQNFFAAVGLSGPAKVAVNIGPNFKYRFPESKSNSETLPCSLVCVGRSLSCNFVAPTSANHLFYSLRSKSFAMLDCSDSVKFIYRGRIATPDSLALLSKDDEPVFYACREAPDIKIKTRKVIHSDDESGSDDDDDDDDESESDDDDDDDDDESESDGNLGSSEDCLSIESDDDDGSTDFG